MERAFANFAAGVATPWDEKRLKRALEHGGWLQIPGEVVVQLAIDGRDDLLHLMGEPGSTYRLPQWASILYFIAAHVLSQAHDDNAYRAIDAAVGRLLNLPPYEGAVNLPFRHFYTAPPHIETDLVEILICRGATDWPGLLSKKAVWRIWRSGKVDRKMFEDNNRVQDLFDCERDLGVMKGVLLNRTRLSQQQVNAVVNWL